MQVDAGAVTVASLVDDEQLGVDVDRRVPDGAAEARMTGAVFFHTHTYILR